MRIQQALQVILVEIQEALAGLKEEDIERFIDAILKARSLFFTGQGRSGMVARAGAMRLMHVGLKTHVVGESATPSISPDDILIGCSSSGTTEITRHLAQRAKDMGAQVAAVTSRRDSPLGSLADVAIEISRPSKDSNSDEKRSAQFGSTLFEQACLLYFDAVALSLIDRLGKSEEEMMSRHSNLE